MSGEKPQVGDEVMVVGRVVHVGEVTVWVSHAGEDRQSGRPLPLGAIRPAAELATLRAENERLRAALTEMVRTHAGSHSEDCHACGAHDDDVSDDPDTPDPHCDCGALATRQAARAALRGGT